MSTITDKFIKRFEFEGAELKVGAPVWIVFDFSLCSGCAWCIDVCPENVFKIKREKLEKKIIIKIKKCINCGNCIDVCKPRAIVDHSHNHLQEYLTNRSKINNEGFRGDMD
ncbi:MAG: 4Fe-4S dicluster domain-containing protein [Candidatus Hodarchaeales archaeon]|jgi:ferredoxin